MPLDKTKYGEMLGSVGFLEDALLKYEHEKGYIGAHRDGIDEKYFEPVEKVIWEFERRKGIKLEDVDVSSCINGCFLRKVFMFSSSVPARFSLSIRNS